MDMELDRKEQVYYTHARWNSDNELWINRQEKWNFKDQSDAQVAVNEWNQLRLPTPFFVVKITKTEVVELG